MTLAIAIHPPESDLTLPLPAPGENSLRAR